MGNNVNLRRVRLHYSVFDMQGNIVESTLEGDPREICLGQGELPAEIENALMDLNPGQELTKLVVLNESESSSGQEVIYEIKLVQILSR